MPASFRDLEEALRDIAVWERHRIALTAFLAARGQIFLPADGELALWRRRLRLIEEAADLLAAGNVPRATPLRPPQGPPA